MDLRRLAPPALSLAALAAAAYLFAASRGAPQAAAGRVDAAPPRVRVAPVAAAVAPRTLRFPGVVRSARRARLGFTVGGRLAARPVTVGERVAAGALLARLDAAELDHALAAARAARQEAAARRVQAEEAAQRLERLAAVRAATAEEREAADAALAALTAVEAAAAARLEEAERRRSEAVLRAPFAGVVSEVYLEPGEQAAAGAPVVRLSGSGATELEVELPEGVVAAVGVGQAAAVVLTATGARVPARVVSAGGSTAGVGRLFPVVVALAGEASPGATAELELALVDDGLLALPAAAVINPGGRQPEVFRVVAGRVERVAVEVVAVAGDEVRVRPAGQAGAALASGDRVVVAGQRGLIAGDAVEAVP